MSPGFLLRKWYVVRTSIILVVLKGRQGRTLCCWRDADGFHVVVYPAVCLCWAICAAGPHLKPRTHVVWELILSLSLTRGC
jgi:hypothetical protein